MFRRYFITGLLIWVPIGITLWVLSFIVTTMDLSLSLLPTSWQPLALFGRHLPGLGALLTLLVIFLTGLLGANFLGQRLVRIWEGLLSRIPIVRTIYSSVKQVSDTLLSPQGNAFRKALLVEYPRKGSWTIGFMTGTPADEVRRCVSQVEPVDADAGVGAEMVSIYVPTTPNPTSGFFLMMRREDTIELDMSVDEALKYIVSMGVVSPSTRARGSARGPSTQIKAEIQ
ncbi:MAG: DUF502 domain-containing protein [Burkholderiaceae bacterium]